jgi:hypothetical protein
MRVTVTSLLMKDFLLFFCTIFVCLQCSVTCGTGVSVRTVVCRSLDGKQVPDSSCSSIEDKPASSQKCTMQLCEREIQVGVVTYFQRY